MNERCKRQRLTAQTLGDLWGPSTEVPSRSSDSSGEEREIQQAVATDVISMSTAVPSNFGGFEWFLG
jgi:hypothetical protein